MSWVVLRSRLVPSRRVGWMGSMIVMLLLLRLEKGLAPSLLGVGLEAWWGRGEAGSGGKQGTEARLRLGFHPASQDV
jgi:hypothetical protein